MNRSALILIVLVAAVVLGGCGDRAETEHEREVNAWHAARLDRLRADDGWLTLIGLFPLPEGAHTLGAADHADLRLEAAVPPLLGTLTVTGGEVAFTAADGVTVHVAGSDEPAPSVLASDRDGTPTVLQHATVSFYVIARGDQLFLRVKDAASKVRAGFKGIDRFPVDDRWRITARLQTRNMPATVPMPNVLGQIEELPTPGVLTFDRDGFRHHLIAIGKPDEPLLIVFGDLTSGSQTYGGGRFVYTEPPTADGTVVIDFNRAYNPPCAFTPYATCLQPLPENRLPLAVTAGEKVWQPQR